MTRQSWPIPSVRSTIRIIYTSLPALILVGYFFSNQSPVLLADLNDFNQDKNIHSTFDKEKDPTDLLTNPWNFINSLRKAKIMENATSPNDAIDDALKGFDTEFEAFPNSELKNIQ